MGVIVGIVFLALEISLNSELTRMQIQQDGANLGFNNNESIYNSDFMPLILEIAFNNKPLDAQGSIRLRFMNRAMNRL